MRASAVVIAAGLVAASILPVAPAHAAVIDWQPCPSDTTPTKQCAWLSVPLRYDRPQGPTIRIALARIPATGKAIGSLLWDAGGPGGVSTDLIDQLQPRMSEDVRRRFDFVAFDPRGIGASRPVLADCRTPTPVRPALDPLPSWRNVQRNSAAELRRANAQCLRSNARIARHMSTNNVVRDLDRIRAALGDRRLTFWATSYGTRIGYVYALRYPQRVRAMVMDGSIDPTAGYQTLPAVGGLATENALMFIKRNARPLYRVSISTMASLTRKPVDLGGGVRFTRWNWLDLVGNIVPFQGSWFNLPALADLVETARVAGAEGDTARSILLSIISMPNSNEGAGFSVVNCLDYADRLSASDQVDVTIANVQRAPLTGGSLTLMYAMGCEGLADLRPDPVPLVTTRAQRDRLAKVPVLLANATADGSTPMPWARQMQRVFDRPMIRYRGSQHVIWGAVESRCVNRPIDRFVLELRMPAKSRTCEFVPPAEGATVSEALSLPAGAG